MRVEQTSREAEPQSAVLGIGPVILVAEDDALVLRYITTLLRRQGYTLLSASDGQMAQELIAGSEPIDLLVTDLSLPNKNGLDLVASFWRMRGREKPALVLSGWPIKEDDLKEGCEALMKPFCARAFCEQVRCALNSPLIL